MAARGVAKCSATALGRNSRRRLGCIAAVLLAVAGCSSGTTTPGSSPAASTTLAQASPTTGSGSAASPSKPFSDAELAAIINTVNHSRNMSFPPAHDSTSLRSGAVSGSFAPTKMETAPANCLVFLPQEPFSRWADKDIAFAEGIIPPSGGQSTPTSTVMVVLRSAERDAIAKADFGYPDDLASRCSQFDLTYTASGQSSTYALHLLAAPTIAEKQHAFMQVTKPKGPGDIGSVGLRVLDGTLSVTLSLAVANLNSESEAKPALDAMSGLAGELIDQARKGAPSVAAPPPNSLSPDQMVALFKGITGPNAEPVSLPQARVLALPPGSTPTGFSRPPDSPCSFNEESYMASLLGSVTGQGQIHGVSKIDYTDFTVISMPSAMAAPYPFDSRAERLRGCTTIEEQSFGGGSRPWSSVSALTTTIPADSSYAVAYQLSDGTGEWHVQSGARRGTLSIEASSRTASQSETQTKADAQAAFFGAVFERAGK
ncbi:hypothetical protein [Arthrobacter sp. Soil764]|uniref:hypothetical protein n=1 Tax=Arthrobacter sp. Soil764 TaxID=1736403 RepID=UPI0006FECEE2|nr:hypothetical protein [Arthrobacter sp. Soil764]KRE91416.1 hypothetical protein ASG86_14700 [Arthrobacter sp. Soil764]